MIMTKYEYIEIRILELTARKEMAENFRADNAMALEVILLAAQIDALVGEHLKMKQDEIIEQTIENADECTGHDCPNFGTTECAHCYE
jgi:hypothetical protein